MSIYFSLDTNCSKIEKASGLKDFKTENYYRIYGLRQEDNPPILLEIKDVPKDKDIAILRRMLARNGIQLIHQPEKWGHSISIGIRYDLRCHVALAAGAVNMIIGYLEGKMTFGALTALGFKKINMEGDPEDDKIFGAK